MPIKRQKITVEECLHLAIKDFAGALKNQQDVSGTLSRDCNGQKLTGNFKLSFSCGHADLKLSYVHNDEQFHDCITLIPQRCYFGGERWWFKCPTRNGSWQCFRKATKLYISRFKQFGCRRCQRLTYQSVQQHDKRFDRLLRDFEALRSALDNPGPAWLKRLASRALFKVLLGGNTKTQHA